ncbi:MAG: hypothetical protein HY321_02935 [Armatimonadetes bacterium]|nr:hypothetical protein [Armatimonadota bacterium]
MPQAKKIAAAASEVVLDLRRGGTCAVYIVEARNRQEVRELKEMFGGLRQELEVRQLAEGTITAYAVRVPGRDIRVFDEIETTLKENYRFSISERAFQRTIYTVVRDLCRASDSVLRAVPACGICQSPDPFPTTVDFMDASGQRLAGGVYCARCVGEADAKDDRELIGRLLAADGSGLAPLGRLRLAQEPRSERPGAGYRVDEEEPRRAAAG